MLNFKPQKVLSLEQELKKKNPKLHGEYLLSEKYNGWFIYFYYDSKKQEWYGPFSSTNKRIKSLNWIIEENNIQFPFLHQNAILIAEAIIPNTDFYEINGLFIRTKNATPLYEVQFKCHDLILLPSTRAAIVRYTYLQEYIDELQAINRSYFNSIDCGYATFDMCKLILISEYNKRLWENRAKAIIDSGGEGLVAKASTSNYSFGKRNSELIKIKMECEIDCLADRIDKTTGKKGNDSITLISKRKNGIEIRTVINKHEDIANIENILGKIVTIKGMYEREDGTIVQPRFSHIREDKDEYQ